MRKPVQGTTASRAASTNPGINTLVNPTIQNPAVQQLTSVLLNNSLTEVVNDLVADKLQSIQKARVEIKKPNSDRKQIELEPEGTIEDQLCAVHNIPNKRKQDIHVYHPLEVNLLADHFYGKTILDESVRMDMRGVDFAMMLKDYADKFGEKRYFYSRPAGVNEGSVYQFDGFGLQTVRDALMHEGLKLLFTDVTPADNGTSSVFEVFRQKVFGWHRFAGEHNLIGSHYSIQEIDNALQSSHEVNVSLKQHLLIYLENLRAQFNRSYEQTAATFTSLTANERNVLAQILVIEKIEEHIKGFASTNTDKYRVLHVAREIPKTSSFGNEPAAKTTTFDLALICTREKMDQFVNGELSNTDRNTVLSKLNQLEQFLATLAVRFGMQYNWVGNNSINASGVKYAIDSFQVNRNLLPLLEKIKDQLLQAQASEVNERIRRASVRENENRNINAFIDQGVQYLNNGNFTDDFIQKVIELMSQTVNERKIVSEEMTKALLSRDSNLLQPDAEFSLDLLPENRQQLPEQLVPQCGLLLTYGLQSQHLRFGVGRHLYSQSLFPGEEVSMELITKSKKEVEITSNLVEKVFEEENAETNTDFNRELNSEFNKSSDYSRKSSSSVEASLNASGFGVQVGASISRSSEASAQVNESVKNVNNTSDKQAKKLSDSREVTFEKTSTERTLMIDETENRVTRKFSNINKERSLTFNFFQITREYQHTLLLDDLRFLYTSGKYKPVVLFLSSGLYDQSSAQLKELARQNVDYVPLYNTLDAFENQGYNFDRLKELKIFRRIPSDVADYYHPGAIIIVYQRPYQQLLSLSQVNAFLAQTFDVSKTTAQEINGLIWRFIGGGSAAPDGLEVAAFAGHQGELRVWPKTGTQNAPSVNLHESANALVADSISVTYGGKKTELKLPNIDLCYQEVSHFRTNFFASSNERSAMPLAVSQKKYVISTDGIYCENMLGHCGALEKFATDHRQMDVEKQHYLNEQERLSIPPDPDKYTKNGVLNVQEYQQAMNLYEQAMRALKGPRQGEIVNAKTNG